MAVRGAERDLISENSVSIDQVGPPYHKRAWEVA